MAHENRDFGERLREIFASAAAHEDDEAAGKMVRDYLGTEDALTMLAARCRVLEADAADRQASFDLRWAAQQRAIDRWRAERPDVRELTRPDHADLLVWLLGRLEGLGDAAMAVANDCRGYLDDEDGPGPREMMRAFLGTLTPAIEAAFPGAEPPYGGEAVTVYVAWGAPEAEEGRLSFRVACGRDALEAELDGDDFDAFLEGLEADAGVCLEAEGDGEGEMGWRLGAERPLGGRPEGAPHPDEAAAAGRVAGALIDEMRRRGLEAAEVSE